MEGLPPAELVASQKAYWVNQAETIDGMLGGFERVHPIDIGGSAVFLAKLKEKLGLDPANGAALDCGCGIGRIAIHLLAKAGFTTIGLLDVCQEFLDRAVEKMPQDIETIQYCVGLAEFDFAGTLLYLATSPQKAIYVAREQTHQASCCDGCHVPPIQLASGRTWDLIWVQWCAIYLTDAAFVEFFRKVGTLCSRRMDGVPACLTFARCLN